MKQSEESKKRMEELALKLFLKPNKTMEDDFKAGYLAGLQDPDALKGILEEIKPIIISALKEKTQNMENYGYFCRNNGVSEDDYEDVAEDVIQKLRTLQGIGNG